MQSWKAAAHAGRCRRHGIIDALDGRMSIRRPGGVQFEEQGFDLRDLALPKQQARQPVRRAQPEGQCHSHSHSRYVHEHDQPGTISYSDRKNRLKHSKFSAFDICYGPR